MSFEGWEFRRSTTRETKKKKNSRQETHTHTLRDRNTNQKASSFEYSIHVIRVSARKKKTLSPLSSLTGNVPGNFDLSKVTKKEFQPKKSWWEKVHASPPVLMTNDLSTSSTNTRSACPGWKGDSGVCSVRFTKRTPVAEAYQGQHKNCFFFFFFGRKNVVIPPSHTQRQNVTQPKWIVFDFFFIV